MTHAGHRAYKKVDQRNRPCDLPRLQQFHRKRSAMGEESGEETGKTIKMN